MIFFTMAQNFKIYMKKKYFFCLGVGWGVGSRTFFFFTKNPNLKKKYLGGGGGGGVWMDGQTNRPKSICPFNFFEVESITMHKCTSYGPDKLNLSPFYHLTFKCDLDLQPT